MTSTNVKSFGIRLKKRLKVMSEEIFKERVEKLALSLNDVMRFSREAVERYLTDNAGDEIGRIKFPKKQSGNLINSIAQGTLDTKPKYKQIGSKIVAKFTGWYALDNKGNGQHSVVDSRNGRNAPYASYLNYDSADFHMRGDTKVPNYNKPYNGFFDSTKEVYRNTITRQLESNFDKIFGTYRY